MHVVVVVVGGGGLVVVVVVVVGGVGAVVDVVVLGAAAGVVVGGAVLVVVPGAATSDTLGGWFVVTDRWGALVVVVVPPGTPETVVDEVVGKGGVVAAAVLGPAGRTGLTSWTACAGRRGLEPPGARRTSTASSRPTAARPPSMPARCEGGRVAGPPSPGSSPVPSSSMSIRSSSAGDAGGSHQRKPRERGKLTAAPAAVRPEAH